MATSNTVVDSFTTQDQINSYLNTLSQKYLANNQYIVSGTNTGFVTAGVTAFAPYANLSNRYYPTVATLPNQSNLMLAAELGGYFLPGNLGASIYLTKNITYSLNTSQIPNGIAYNVIDPTRFNKGRGLTQNDQSNIVTHYIDNNWMKAINVSDQFDGNIINTDTYQKFIPYQSAYETTKTDSNGVVNARYDFEFWTGPEKQTWNETNSSNTLDRENYFNLQNSINNLVYTAGKELYSWNTDIFGTQYAFYKPIITPPSFYNSLYASGTLWVKTPDGTINQAPSALNTVFNAYQNNSAIYRQLSSNNILNFEVFYNTLIIQLSGYVLYEGITLDYNTYTISNTTKTYLALNYGLTLSNALLTNFFTNQIGTPGVSAQTYYGGNWYDTSNNTITICTLLSSTLSGSANSIVSTSGLSSLIVPVLYSINLNDPNSRTRIFPTNSTNPYNFLEYIYPINNSASNEVSFMEDPVFSYNKDTNLYIINFLAYNYHSQQTNLISYKISS